MNKTAKQVIGLIEKAIETGVSVNDVCISNGKARNYVANYLYYIGEKLSTGSITREEYVKVNATWDLYKNQKATTTTSPDEVEKFEVARDEYDAETDEKYDKTSRGFILRETNEMVVIHHTLTGEDEGSEVRRITGYGYNIKVKGEEDLAGELTREEMDLVYRLYSNYGGSGLSQREVSRHFPQFTFKEFKRILRVFNVTKNSICIAPHVLEEKSVDEALELVNRYKENQLLKKQESDVNKNNEALLRKARAKIIELETTMGDWDEFLKSLDLSDIEPFTVDTQELDGERALILYLSDQHVGAHTNDDSIYENKYDGPEFNRRMAKTLELVVKQHSIYGRFDKIIAVNLGDTLDGYNSQTTRGGHALPQNMNNKVQFNVYVEGMISFFESLHKMNMSNSIAYHAVGDSNHSGDFGYIAERAIQLYFKNRFPEMEVVIYEGVIGHFEYGDHTYIILHGKDKADKKFGFPLVLDVKTENYFNEYIDYHEIKSKAIHVLSGDLHQSATTYGKRFRYRKTLSMYGSSAWIHNNFGNTKPGLDYEIVEKYGDMSSIKEGRIYFK